MQHGMAPVHGAQAASSWQVAVTAAAQPQRYRKLSCHDTDATEWSLSKQQGRAVGSFS